MGSRRARIHCELRPLLGSSECLTSPPSATPRAHLLRCNFSEYCRVGADPRCLSGDAPLATFDGATERAAAAVLERWDAVAGTWAGEPGAALDTTELPVPLLHECCFPLGVPLRLEPAAGSSSRALFLPPRGTSSRQHSLQFPCATGLVYGVVVTFPVVVDDANPAVVARLRAVLRRCLAAAIVAGFVRHVGGAAAFAAFAAARKLPPAAPVYPWPSTKLRFTSSLAPPVAPRGSLAAAFFKRGSEAAPTAPVLGPVSEVRGPQTTAASGPARLPAGGCTCGGGRRRALAGVPVSSESREWRRRCRACLAGPVTVVTEEAVCIVSASDRHHAALLRILEAVRDAAADTSGAPHQAGALPRRASASALSRARTRQASAPCARRPRESMLAVMGTAEDFTDSDDGDDDDDASDDEEAPAFPEAVAAAAAPVVAPAVAEESAPVTSTTAASGAAAGTVVSRVRARRQRRLGAFLDAAAGDEGLPAAGGTWRFRFQPLGIRIEAELPAERLADWTLAVLFRYVLSVIMTPRFVLPCILSATIRNNTLASRTAAGAHHPPTCPHPASAVPCVSHCWSGSHRFTPFPLCFSNRSSTGCSHFQRGSSERSRSHDYLAAVRGQGGGVLPRPWPALKRRRSTTTAADTAHLGVRAYPHKARLAFREGPRPVS